MIRAFTLPYCTHPCPQCPFRKDTLKGWLGRERMNEILSAKSFVCHKSPSLQCAGHMILKKDENAFCALAKLLKIDLPMKGADLIFDTEKDCVDHHAHGRKK